MCCLHQTTRLPGHIETAMQCLRFAEEIHHPASFDGSPRNGRDLSKTEAEVHDSALTVLLDDFNQPITPTTADNRSKQTPASGDDEISF